MDITDNPFQDAAKVTEDPWKPPETSDAPPGPRPPDHANSIAWERERSFTALKETLLDVLLKPGATFRDAHPDVSLWPALSFLLIFGCLGVMLSLTIDFVSSGIRAGASIATATQGFMGLFRWILLLVPLRIIASTFVNAGLLHLALMMTGANTLRYGASFRISAYCGGATAVFSAVPMIGHWVGLLALFLVQVPAIKHMHKTTDGKAAFAAIAPIILRWAFYGGLALVGIYSIASLFG